jgi:flagellar basal-body rod protein FlgG
MLRSLNTAASGMTAQQANIDVVSNNLANINTTGFKRGRVDFQDLMYANLRIAGTPSSMSTTYPTSKQIGTGVEVAATQKIFEQGARKETGVETDLRIIGEGFFKVRLADGTEAYTRDGSWKIDGNGDLVTHNGNYLVDPPLNMPKDYYHQDLKVNYNGEVSVKVPGSDREIFVGQIRLYRFVNPGGLQAVGSNLFKESVGSGPAYEGVPGGQGYGQLEQKALEVSNVQVGNELVNMIVAQRAYEFSAKAIQTSDSMLATAVNLKR